MMKTLIGLLWAIIVATGSGCVPDNMPVPDDPAPQAVIEVNEPQWIKDERAGGFGYAEIGPLRSYAPMAVFFEGWKSSPKESITDYSWDFGDGSAPMSGFNAAHVYETPGTYTVTLTVTNDFGVSDTDTIPVQVLASDGTTFYVDSAAGDDANDGLAPERAWKTATHAFRGMTENRYGPGDRILFKRGGTYTIAVGDVEFLHWRHGYGYHFGAYGTGEKPLIQLVGPNSGELLNNWASGMAHVGFVDLAFDLTSSEGAKATLYFNAGKTVNLLALRVDVRNFDQGWICAGELNGLFLVDTTMHDSQGSHVYTTSMRVAMLRNSFDYSANHLAYLEVLWHGVIVGNEFSRSAFGRHALRISDGGYIYAAKNDISGWIDPRTGEPRWNWLLVHLAPNTGDPKKLRRILFEENVLRNAETLLNIGSAEDMVVRRNTFSKVDMDSGEAAAILIGSKHAFDRIGCSNILITENTILSGRSERPGIVGHVFFVRERSLVDPSLYTGGPTHKALKFTANEIILMDNMIRVLGFDIKDADQEAEVDFSSNTIRAPGVDNLFDDGNSALDLSTWLDTFRGNRAGIHVDTSREAPFPGWIKVPPTVISRPFPVQYAGVADLSGTGIKRVELWVRPEDGSWSNSGLVSQATEGVFEYVPPVLNAAKTYYFALLVEDNAGNRSPMPEGEGQAKSSYWPL